MVRRNAGPFIDSICGMTFKTRFQKFLGLETKSTLSASDPWLAEAFGATPSAANIAVSAATAIRCAPVRAAVAAISEPLGFLPAHVYRRGSDGARTRASNHPVEKLLSGAVNEFSSASTFREHLTTDALLQHGGFAYIGRAGEGKPVDLFQLPASTVTVEIDPFSGPRYKVTDENGKTSDVPRENILHLPSPSLSGKGLVYDCREAIGGALALERCGNAFVANNAKAGVLITVKDAKPGDLDASPKAVKNLRALWNAQFKGNGAGDTAVLPGDLDLKQFTLSFADSQFIEMREFAIDEIARVFNISPIFLQKLGRATWSNSEQAKDALLSVTLMPWVRRWEAELNLKLLTEAEREAGYYIEFKIEGFVHADYAAKTEGINKLIASRVINPNEARAMFNLPPYKGGDQFINPNVTPVPGAANATG